MSKTKSSDSSKRNSGNAYARIIEAIFSQKFRPGSDYVEFARTDIEENAALLNIPLPKNLGDLIYSFRYRQPLPDSIFAFEIAGKGEQRTVALSAEKHYQPLPPDQISAEDLRLYARNTLEA